MSGHFRLLNVISKSYQYYKYIGLYVQCTSAVHFKHLKVLLTKQARFIFYFFKTSLEIKFKFQAIVNETVQTLNY